MSRRGRALRRREVATRERLTLPHGGMAATVCVRNVTVLSAFATLRTKRPMNEPKSASLGPMVVEPDGFKIQRFIWSSTCCETGFTSTTTPRKYQGALRNLHAVREDHVPHLGAVPQDALEREHRAGARALELDDLEAIHVLEEVPVDGARARSAQRDRLGLALLEQVGAQRDDVLQAAAAERLPERRGPRRSRETETSPGTRRAPSCRSPGEAAATRAVRALVHPRRAGRGA